MKAFSDLTVLGQARRLRPLALAALGRYDLDVQRVRLLTNDFNCIFRLDTAGGDKYILRISLPLPHGAALEHIQSEMMWLAALRRDTDLSVPKPLPTSAGEWVTTLRVDGVPEPRHCVIFSWVPGRDLGLQLSLKNVERFGELAARLHEHGAAFAPPEGFSIRRFDRVFPTGEEVLLFDDEHRHLLPSGRRELFESVAERVQVALDRLAASETMRVIHADLHHWNVKVLRGRVSALDFEELMWGYPVQDIGTTFYYLQDREDFPAIREAFKRGYTAHAQWPEKCPGEIDTFIAGRGLVLSNGIITDPNPEWREKTRAYIEHEEVRMHRLLGDVNRA